MIYAPMLMDPTFGKGLFRQPEVRIYGPHLGKGYI